MPPLIALVANSSWNLHHFRRPLIQRLLAAGYVVLLLAPEDEYSDELRAMSGVRYLPLRHLAPKGRSFTKDLRLWWELYRHYRREKPEVILHYTIKPNIYGSLAARLAGRSSIATLTGLGYTFIHQSAANRLVPLLYWLALRRVHYVVFHNADDRQLFLQKKLTSATNSLVIPGSGIDTRYFTAQPFLSRPPFVFLFIGRLLADKGLREYVAATATLRSRHGDQVVCRILGEPSPRNPAAISMKELQQWQAEGNVQYLGQVADVRPTLKEAHALVLPSYREGMPRAVLEAMAMGRPVITTDTPGCRDTVEDGRNGFLVPIKDAEALADAMSRLLFVDGETLTNMGKNGRQKVKQRFDERLIVDQYLKLIHEIVPY